MVARPEPIRNTKFSELNILIAGSLPAVNLVWSDCNPAGPELVNAAGSK